MSIRNRDIIERIERSGNYSSAQEFRKTLRENHHSEHECADRYNPADGAQHSHTGDIAEQAYHSLRRDAAREEERREEEQHRETMERQHYEQQREEEQREEA